MGEWCSPCLESYAHLPVTQFYELTLDLIKLFIGLTQTYLCNWCIQTKPWEVKWYLPVYHYTPTCKCLYMDCGLVSKWIKNIVSVYLPVSATFLIVCLKAQMMESKTSLNCAGGIARNAGKQWELTAWSSKKKFVLCSGYSSKS